MDENEVMKTKRKKSYYIILAGVIVCACILVGLVAVAIYQYQSTHDFPQPIADKDIQAEIKDINAGRTSHYVKIDWKHWKAVNSNIVAWVYVPGTPINYPVMQAKKSDPTYYLTHDIYNSWNVYGAAYIDCNCTPNSMDVIIFGHHFGMDNTAGFSEFINYKNINYMKKHPIVFLFTPDSTRLLPVRAAGTVNGGSDTKQTGFTDQTQLSQWYMTNYNAATTKLPNHKGETISQVFLFVTCSYSTENERTLVYAVNTKD